MPRAERDQTTHDDARQHLPAPALGDGVGLPSEGSSASRPGHRHVSRRVFLSLAVSGLLLAACKKEQVVYVEAPTPVPPPPTAVPTAQPTPEPKPEAKPAVPTPNRGPIQLPAP